MLYFVFFNFRNLQVWILGLCQTEIQHSKPKSLQNEFRKLNQASTDGLRCPGGPPESPIDISCILTRPDFLGMSYLLVINLVINLLQKIITQSQKLLHRVLCTINPNMIREHDFTTTIDTVRPQHALQIWFYRFGSNSTMVSSPVAYLTPAQKGLDFGLTEPQNISLQVSEVNIHS